MERWPKKRKYYTLKTANLVRESLFVIAHDSLSTSYAIFNYKPIIFIYTNQIKNHSIDTRKQYLQIKVLADTLGSKLLNIDNYKEEELIFNNVDKRKYDDFKYKYLVSKNTENKLSSKIFVNNIMKINEHAEKFTQNQWEPCKIYSKSMKILQNLVKINENQWKSWKHIEN